MVLEHAVLHVGVGQRAAFEAAMRDALPLIAETPGFIDLEIRDCVETPGKYLLLVSWETLAAHTNSFRESTRYATWKKRLHHFYEPFPVVEHFGEPVIRTI